MVLHISLILITPWDVIAHTVWRLQPPDLLDCAANHLLCMTAASADHPQESNSFGLTVKVMYASVPSTTKNCKEHQTSSIIYV